jgi:hypothetical protein
MPARLAVLGKQLPRSPWNTRYFRQVVRRPRPRRRLPQERSIFKQVICKRD